MRPAVQHDAPGGNAHSRDYIILLLELTIEGILSAVDIEGRRQIALGQPACIHISHAEAAIEGIDHACGGGIGENGVQLVRHIGAVQRRAGHIFVIVHQKFTGLNAARRKAHDGNIIWVNTIDLRIFADKTDGSRHIQRTFLLRIRRQAVIYDEGLKAQLSQCCGGGQRIGVVAPKLISAARHQHHRAFWLHAIPDGDSGDIGAEVPVIEISGHVLRKFRPDGDIAFLPEIEHLNVCRVCCRVQHGVITCRFRHLLQHGCAGIIGNLAAAVVVCIRKIVRRGYGVRRRSVTQIIDGGGRSRTAFVWFRCHSILNSRNAVFQLTAGSPDGLPATGGQRHDHENCKHCGENSVPTHYRPSPLTQDCTSSLETPEENRWPSCHSPVPAISASKLPL